MGLTKVPRSQMTALNLAGKAVATEHRQLNRWHRWTRLWMGSNANMSCGLCVPGAVCRELRTSAEDAGAMVGSVWWGKEKMPSPSLPWSDQFSLSHIVGMGQNSIQAYCVLKVKIGPGEMALLVKDLPCKTKT